MKHETMKIVRKERLKLSQRKLGLILGYSKEQMSNIETGKSPMPKWMPYALHSILLVGSNDPFEGV